MNHRCHRCNHRLAVYQCAQDVGYEAVCADCLSTTEKRDIDACREAALLAKLNQVEACEDEHLCIF